MYANYIAGNEPALPSQYDDEVGDHGRKIFRVFTGLTIEQQFFKDILCAAIAAGEYSIEDHRVALAENALQTARAAIEYYNAEEKKRIDQLKQDAISFEDDF